MIETLKSLGLIGLFVGSFLAATVVPFSSDALYAAILVVTKQPVACLIVGTLGNWLGGLTSFGIGWIGRWEWIERWFHIKHDRIEKHRSTVLRFGSVLALFTWLPFVGDVFALALGFYRARPVPCALFMLLGKLLRFLCWTLLYYFSDVSVFLLSAI